LQRPFFIAGHRHAVPRRVFAPHRRRFEKARFMGFIVSTVSRLILLRAFSKHLGAAKQGIV
jgi:hypothetical protein